MYLSSAGKTKTRYVFSIHPDPSITQNILYQINHTSLVWTLGMNSAINGFLRAKIDPT